MRKAIAVLGLQFGDEGKGRVVDALCRSHAQVDRFFPAPSVVRFSGAGQAGHHVVTADGVEHVFKHFGSGTLVGAPTYWTKYCPVDPVMLLKEYNELKEKGARPKIFLHPECPLVTPFEILWNFMDSTEIPSGGTCRMGVFATYRRERDHHHIWAEDMRFASVLKRKVDLLRDYAHYRSIPEGPLGDIWDGEFFAACSTLMDNPDIQIGSGIKGNPVIFEGSQGLMLDQEYGFFPYVTPSNTGTKNLVDMGYDFLDLYLVTRAYQTRHGAGPMSRIVEDHGIKVNPYEKNPDDGSQGEFRRTLLDLEMLRYATMKDQYIMKCTLVITCMDLMDGNYRLLDGNREISCAHMDEFVHKIANSIVGSVNKVLISDSPHGELKTWQRG